MTPIVAGVPVAAVAPQLALAAAVVGALLSGIVSAPRWFVRLLTLGGFGAALWLAALAAPVDGAPLLRADGLGLSWQWLVYLAALPAAAMLAFEDEVPAALLLGSTLGMGLLASAATLPMLFIGLEFMSLPAYLLVARGSKRPAAAREAAVKYFFAGATAGALFLLGMALHYAAARSLDLAPAAGPLADTGLALMGAAALFKIGAVPLHFWLPDAYEAAEPELAGFLSTAMKAAAVLLLMRLAALNPISPFVAALPFVGGLTMLAGAVMALKQQRLQRLLAYSSISHAGYLILGVGAWADQGAQPSGAVAVFFYLTAYAFMSNGAFAFLRVSGLSTRQDLKGYASRQPRLAALWAVLLLALGGVPPTAGFLAKMLVLWDAVKAGMIGPALIGGLAALVSLGYYLVLIRDAYFEDPETPSSPEPLCNWPSRIVLLACVIPSAVLGALPWILEALPGALAR